MTSTLDVNSFLTQRWDIDQEALDEDLEGSKMNLKRAPPPRPSKHDFTTPQMPDAPSTPQKHDLKDSSNDIENDGQVLSPYIFLPGHGATPCYSPNVKHTRRSTSGARGDQDPTPVSDDTEENRGTSHGSVADSSTVPTQASPSCVNTPPKMTF